MGGPAASWTISGIAARTTRRAASASTASAASKRMRSSTAKISAPYGKVGQRNSKISGAEGRHLASERLLEGRPCLAALLVGNQCGFLFQQMGVAQDPQHRRHEDVGRGERFDQMIAAVEAGGELREPLPHRCDR